jgi:acetylglutamate kinase
VVVKLGGSVIDGEGLDGVLRGVARLHRRGFRCTVVHGGGASVTRTLEELGVECRFVDGLRVTDAATMDVVEMVLSGRVGPRIVGRLRALGVRAVGLSGVDGGLLTARSHPDAGRLGRVGEIVAVDPAPLHALASARLLPVVSPVSADARGVAYNVNADRAASALAVALEADRLVIVTDVEAVRRSDGRPLESLTAAEARGLIDEGVATDGMVPKLRSCVDALEKGLAEARLARVERAGDLVSVALGRSTAGTVVRRAPSPVGAVGAGR